MKVFVTGVNGQLGHDIMNELAKRRHEAVGSDITEKYAGIQDGSAIISLPYVRLDITDAQAVKKVITQAAPEVVVHCAAWTAVDLAEEEDKKEKVRSINVSGTQNIADVCRDISAKLIYISTDYVFDGQGREPWKADCMDYNPLNTYGQTKLEGEFAVANTLDKYFIVRISWVFGVSGNNFVKTMLKAGKTHNLLSVVRDQIGNPTYTYDLARLLIDMAETQKYGYYHASNEGEYISWYDFAVEIFRQAAALGHPEYDASHLSVNAVTTEEYGISKAKRPFNSRLDKSKLAECGFTPLPAWQDALSRYLKLITF